MATIPDTRAGKIEFYQSHLEAWAQDPPAIGLSAGEVAELAALVDSARAGFLEQGQARNAAMAATLAFHTRVAAMHTHGAGLLATIKAFAESGGDPGVYIRAKIPAPAIPSKAPPPGTPANFRAQLRGDGALSLSWKCKNPRGTEGTIYEVMRQVRGEAGFRYIGAVGVKRFTDDTLPAGAAEVHYRITAVRSTARGKSALFVVNLGVASPALRAREAA